MKHTSIAGYVIVYNVLFIQIILLKLKLVMRFVSSLLRLLHYIII